jgi:hypothetical protein
MFGSGITAQTIDMGFSRETLESYLVGTGFWGNPELRDRHGYQLSPAAYVLSGEQASELERLSEATHSAVSSLNQQLVAYAARSPKLTNGEAGLLKRAKIATRGLLSPYDGVNEVPPVLKVDLVQDVAGHFRIVEVDSYNPRGFGYATLLERSLPELWRTPRLPGIERLATMIGEHSSQVDTWYLLVSEFERYYETSARIFVRALNDFGVAAKLVREQELYQNPGHPLFTDPSAGVLVIPDTLDQYPQVRQALVKQYQNGTLTTFYPPLSYLGSKGFLPELREQPGMDEFLPKTTLVGKKHNGWKDRVDPHKPQVLKATVSSGMKKVLFSDLDTAGFCRTLEEASNLPGSSWILQEQVEQEPIPIVAFDDDGARVENQYFLRITAYVSAQGLVDAEITGRPDRKVHGAPDCIQIPVLVG